MYRVCRVRMFFLNPLFPLGLLLTFLVPFFFVSFLPWEAGNQVTVTKAV